MTKTLTELSKEITDWQDATFTQATAESAAIHLVREVKELLLDIQYHASMSDRSKEIADCFLLICGVAHLSGVNLEEVVEEKMEINRNRVWGKPDADGVVEHIEPSKVAMKLDSNGNPYGLDTGASISHIRMMLDGELPG
jgi:NTP pyrophosphatase (non-canonical NTP hydrolase)